MLSIDIPGFARLALEHLVLDVNGTLAFDGEPLPGVREALAALAPQLRVVAITADTYGGAQRLALELGMDVQIIAPGAEGEQKAAFVRELGAASVVAIGNGANDAMMLEEAAVGIAIMGPEGASATAVAAADAVVCDIRDGLGLLVGPGRLVATLRR